MTALPKTCPREYRIDGRIPSNWKAHHRAATREAIALAREASGRARRNPPIPAGGEGMNPRIQTSQGPSSPILEPLPARQPKPCVICPAQRCPVCGWEV